MPRRKVARRLLVAAVTAGRCQLTKVRPLFQDLKAHLTAAGVQAVVADALVKALTEEVRPKTRYEMLMSDDDLGVDP